MKNNAIFEPTSMRACSSTPPKQNQDFVKELNRTPLRYSNASFRVKQGAKVLLLINYHPGESFIPCFLRVMG